LATFETLQWNIGTMQIDGNDLIDAGWQPSAQFPEMLAAARALEDRGITDKSYALKLLARDFPKPPSKLTRREQPLPLAEAIHATSEADERNIGNVRRFMKQLLRVPVIEGGAVMPDACPAGAAEATIPVGGAIAVRNAILPAAHSADICCSMYATFFHCEKDTGEMLDHLIDSTRFGFGGRKADDIVHHPVLDEPVWENKFLKGLEGHAAMHMADQGDGNHFAYIGKVSWTEEALDALRQSGHGEIARAFTATGSPRSESYALVTHHGSRGLGAQVYKRGHKAAIKETARIAEGIPKAAAWLDTETDIGSEYWDALQYVSRWTKANHQSIHQRFLSRAGSEALTAFGNEHNFVWKRGDNTYLHGKGATPAWTDEESGHPLLGLIPLNMAEPILITLGRDNSDYLSFAPHGAGRNQSRTATLKDFRKANGDLDPEKVNRAIARATQGLDIRWFHGKADLTESPVGYKSATQVRQQIEHYGLADIIAQIEPLGCVMAGDPGPRPWLRKREDYLSPKQKRQIQHRAERRKTRQSLSTWEEEHVEE
jgi:RNA-splicing ligase RtcB